MSNIQDPRQHDLRQKSFTVPQRVAGSSALAMQPSADKVQLATRGLFKSYLKGSFGIPVLQGIDLSIYEGEFLAIVGSSGCGKSTLLHLLGTLDKPDAGEIHFDGNRIDNLPNASRDLLRNKHFGMIFQFYHLLPELTAFENVLAPALIAEGTLSYWRRRGAHRRRAEELLEMVGITARAKHKPRELSGGEMQRAAIARALLSHPRVLLADEPTGNLDRTTGEQIMQILRELNHREKLTIVMVTHDPWIAEQADRTVRLVEGRIQRV
jgi:lipoprotein-releasing system ATP-binding protein